MFTIFHAFRLLAPLVGLILGYECCRHYGIVSGLIGTIAGGCLGLLAGRVPSQLSDWFVFQQLSYESTPQLWSHLTDEAYLMPNCVLVELRRRGEPMTEGLNVVLSMLTSDDRPRRLRGYAAFLSVFPELASHMERYNPDASDMERIEVIDNFKCSL